jgi:hypothetical protein
MDLAAFSRKFAGDMRGTQAGTPYFGIYAPGTVQSTSGSGAGWSDAGVVIPWTSWLQTGDTSVIEENWAAMEKYLKAIEAANPDGLWKHESGIPFGDWLSPEGKTDYVLIATAYWAYDTTLMQQMAHATGRTAEERKYAQQFEKIRTAFQKQQSVAVRGNQQSQRQEQRGRNAGRLRAGAAHEFAAGGTASGGGKETRGQDRGQPWTAGHGIPGDSVFAGRTDQGRKHEAGLQAAAQYGIPVVGLFGWAWRDDHVGALERRPDERRPEHELL